MSCTCVCAVQISLILLSYMYQPKAEQSHNTQLNTVNSQKQETLPNYVRTCNKYSRYDSDLDSTIMSGDPFPDKARMLERNEGIA